MTPYPSSVWLLLPVEDLQSLVNQQVERAQFNWPNADIYLS